MTKAEYVTLLQELFAHKGWTAIIRPQLDAYRTAVMDAMVYGDFSPDEMRAARHRILAVDDFINIEDGLPAIVKSLQEDAEEASNVVQFPGQSTSTVEQ